ncbi:unnamed protein product [Linum tenue]|uniref:Uncharacterized protein n=1 Tax=Linum tenue TaxID=586396 RepID=A0AAV0R1X4_9ROSI|nr:unnamed protein product [Linum tenue]
MGSEASKGKQPIERGDGWLEIELGRFYNEGGNGDGEEMMETCLKEVDGVHLKGGPIVEGIKIRSNSC